MKIAHMPLMAAFLMPFAHPACVYVQMDMLTTHIVVLKVTVTSVCVNNILSRKLQYV